MATDNRGYVSMECGTCKSRNYRTSKRLKGQVPKLEIKKYCKFCRVHTDHKERKK